MKIYSLYEVTVILNVSRKTLTKYINAGELKAVRLGNQIRITEEAFNEFIHDKQIQVKEKPIDVLKKK